MSCRAKTRNTSAHGHACKILNVSVHASALEIKKAYKKLASKYHPDKTNGDKSKEEKFKEIQTAYTLLKNTSAPKVKPQAQAQARKAKKIYKYPVKQIRPRGNGCLSALKLWKIIDFNAHNVSTPSCENFLLSLLEINATAANKKRLDNYLNSFFAKQPAYIVLGDNLIFKSDNTYQTVAFTVMLIVEMYTTLPVVAITKQGDACEIKFMNSFFAEMKSPYKINCNGEKVKLNFFEKAYQKYKS